MSPKITFIGSLSVMMDIYIFFFNYLFHSAGGIKNGLYNQVTLVNYS